MSLSLFQVHEKEVKGQAQSCLLKLLGVTGKTLNSEPQIFCSTASVGERQDLLHPPPWNAPVLMPTGILFFFNWHYCELIFTDSFSWTPVLLTEENTVEHWWKLPSYLVSHMLLHMQILYSYRELHPWTGWSIPCFETEILSFIPGLTGNCAALLTATLTPHSVDTSHEAAEASHA